MTFPYAVLWYGVIYIIISTRSKACLIYNCWIIITLYIQEIAYTYK